MATPVSPPKQNQSAKRDFLSDVQTGGSGLPPRIVLHGVEGIGKSSMFAYAPNPIYLMSSGETGLETLIDSGRLPEIPHFPECLSWSDLIQMVESLTEQEHDYKTLVIDTLNGGERLCHEHVCKREYNGDWGEKGFASYQRGYDVSLADWRLFLNALDKLRSEKKMIVVCLVHTKVTSFKNPEGPDYDRYAPDMHHKTWSLTHKWADMVLFANFHTEVSTDKGRSKGQGGRQRIVHTERHASYDAKNRHGLPEEISMGNSGQDAWTNLYSAVKTAKKGGE
jgi:hypothetical protein